MPQNELTNILAQYKDSIWLILTWFAGSITHIFNKIRKWENLTFLQHMCHLIVSWFVGCMAWFICTYFSINLLATHIIIWMSTYLSIQIIDALDMIKARFIYDLFMDFLKFRIWKK